MKSLGGSLAGAPSAVSCAPDRLDVFATGPTNTVWHWWLEGATWNGPQPLAPAGGDGIANIPAEGLCAVSSGPGRLEVFAAGSNGNTPWWWRWDGAIWTGPRKLPQGADLPPCQSPQSAPGRTTSTFSLRVRATPLIGGIGTGVSGPLRYSSLASRTCAPCASLPFLPGRIVSMCSPPETRNISGIGGGKELPSGNGRTSVGACPRKGWG